jgi:diguanylate cyclase (GGDEF)-like protein
VKLISHGRGALALAIPVIMVAAGVFATADLQRSTAQRGADQQQASQTLLTAMLDQETGARGYFQTHQLAFLEPWEEGTLAAVSSLATLRSLTSGNADLQPLLTDQARRANVWHLTTERAIVDEERTGRSQTVALAHKTKVLMDAFRASHDTFDASLARDRRESLSRATYLSVAVAVALAALLGSGGLLLTRRSARREETRQRAQADLRELLQASESEQESRGLLISHVEHLIPKAAAAVLNRNNSDDRLEITDGGHDSVLRDANTEHMRPRSCMAVRLSHSHDHQPGVSNLAACEICGAIKGAATCEPLLVDGRVIGSVLVASKTSIGGELRARLRDSVAQAAPILANQRNLAIAQRRAASDALTGLPNRRAADEVFKLMAAQASRSGNPLTAILLDLDHFKDLNDQHGHESGDRALAFVGSIISSSIRSSDFAARFGGEEFLVLLPGTDRPSAIVVAEKLRSEIAHAELAGIPPISASLGLAELPTDASEPEDLLRKADRALYSAKAAGRNRVHVFSHSPGEDESALDEAAEGAVDDASSLSTISPGDHFGSLPGGSIRA